MNMENKKVGCKGLYDTCKESWMSAAEWAREQGLKLLLNTEIRT